MFAGLAAEPSSTDSDDELPIAAYLAKKGSLCVLEERNSPAAAATRRTARAASPPQAAESHSLESDEEAPLTSPFKRNRAVYVSSSSEEDRGTVRARGSPRGCATGGTRSPEGSLGRSADLGRRASARHVIEDSSESEGESRGSAGGTGKSSGPPAHHPAGPSMREARSEAEEGDDGEEGVAEGEEMPREPASARKRLRQRRGDGADGPDQGTAGVSHLWETPRRGPRTRRGTRGQLRSSQITSWGGAAPPGSPQEIRGTAGGGTEVRRTQRVPKEVPRVVVGDLRERQREHMQRLEAGSDEEASDAQDSVVDLTGQ